MAYKTEGSSALAPNDPFRGAFDPEISPSLKVLEGGKKDKPNKPALAKDASKNLGQAEKGATENPLQKVGAGAKNILNAESSTDFKNNVQGLPLVSKKGKGKGKFKKAGPALTIAAIFLLVAGLVLGGQSLLPFSLLAQFIGNFDSISVSTSMRSRVFLRYQTDGNVKSATKKTVFHGEKFAIKGKQEAKLKSQGIEKVEVETSKGKKTVLIFDDGSGKRTLITPSEKNADLFDGIKKVKLKNGKTVEVGQRMTFEDAYTKLSDFFNGYNKASRTWKGSVGHWFDKQIVKFLDLTDLTRNRFKKFREKVAEAEAANTKSGKAGKMSAQAAEMDAAKQATTDTMKETGDSNTTIKSRISETEDGTDADGNPTKTTTIGDTEVDTGKPGEIDAAKAKTVLDDAAKKTKKSASSITSLVANVGCGILAFTGTASAIVYANEKLQVLKVITSFTEAVDKVKAGQGADSPIHVFATALVSPQSGVKFKLSDEGKVLAEVNQTNEEYPDDNLNNIDLEKETTEPKSAMEAEAIAAMYDNRPANQNDYSLSSFGASGNMANKALSQLGATTASFVGCAILKATAAAIGIIEDFLFPGSGEMIKQVAKGVAIGGTIAIATRVLLPMVTKSLTRDLISNLGGEDFGNALVYGAHMYQADNHRFSGGSLTDKDGLIAFSLEQQKVIADNARYERENRSPFDPTSQHTFLGTILTQVATLYTNRTAVSGLVTTMGNLTRNSLTTLLPSANAVIANKMVQSTGDCSNLKSIGAVGDAFCNPYIITDVKTIDDDPEEVVQKLASENEVEINDDGQISINKSSNLARYITYCGSRQSQFGTADQNIANDFSATPVNKAIDGLAGDSTGGQYLAQGANLVTDSVVSSIPFVGDLVDIAQNTNQLLNSGWITGASCVANNTYSDNLKNAVSQGSSSIDTSGITAPNWNQTRYYQRFAEDQRLMESLDPAYTSAVVAYLDSYYEEHPIDHSYEDMLARHSGLTKENVVAVLNVIDYMNYVAQYDPATRYSFVEQAPDTPPHIDNGNIVTTTEPAIERPAIVYYDLRTRTTTV